jgi:hypothetical protein
LRIRHAHEPRQVEHALALTPLRASASNIRPVLFADEYGFLGLRLSPEQVPY